MIIKNLDVDEKQKYVPFLEYREKGMWKPDEPLLRIPQARVGRVDLVAWLLHNFEYERI
jgi:hypothetical protein